MSQLGRGARFSTEIVTAADCVRADLSSVMTPFCVLLYREDNADGAVVYVDDIEYRG